MDLINCYLLYIRTYFFQDKRPWLVDEDPKANGLYVSTVKKKKKKEMNTKSVHGKIENGNYHTNITFMKGINHRISESNKDNDSFSCWTHILPLFSSSIFSLVFQDHVVLRS